MSKKKAFKKVFKELKKCGLFMGKYDARHGSDIFMDGICTVMEYIAYEISNKEGNKYNKKFFNNLAKSKAKAGTLISEVRTDK